ncbi:hypothetical protein OS493_009051 [Desmophyllum pertusum]|uniref:AAA+ ATPase domain-containing protein n=1 Tax=Desmophyllum pertusum TaxID=174260 RepID=A0A9W9ZGH7_9CNID|nr:hypothetical protein OS493_009051 [Desmophyllum pertusum]
MKLLVVDFIPELFAASSKGNISNYRGDAVIETPFFIMEDQTAVAVKNKVMAVIKNQYDDYGGQFVFASRRNRNFLSIAGEQDLDARGVHTLKGSGCVYVVLDTPVGPTDEEGFQEEDPTTETIQPVPVSARVSEERSRQFRQETLRSLLDHNASSNTDVRETVPVVDDSVPTSMFFVGHNEDIHLKDSGLKETGFMNPDKRKSSLISVLAILQWIKPFMTLVSRGGSEFLTSILKCYGIRGIADFRVNEILDSLLTSLGISAESRSVMMDPNYVLQRMLQIIFETEEEKGTLTSIFGGKMAIRTTLNSSQSEEIIFEEDNQESSSPAMMFNLKMPRESSSTVTPPRLRDLLNESLKHGQPIPFSSWKDAWKEKYSGQNTAEGSESDPCAINYQTWTDCPDCLIVGLNRASKQRSWNTKLVSLDSNIPVADLLKPEDETLHSINDLSESYKLFGLIVKSEGDRVYACVKTEAESDKCFYVRSWSAIKKPGVPPADTRDEILKSIGNDEDCIIIQDTVQHEAVLHRMEKAMNGFIGLDSLKEQFLRFTRTQLQNDRRKRLGRRIREDTPLHLVFAGNPGTGKTTFARRVAEVQRSALVGQYLGSTTEKTKGVIKEARGGVLFVDEAYRLIPTAGGKDFGREAIEELMAVMEDGDPVMIFAGYERQMEKFLDVNPGLRSWIYRRFVFPDYTPAELGEIFYMKAREKGFSIDDDVDVSSILSVHTTPEQRKNMNARLVRILLQESIEESSNRVPLNAPLDQLMEIKESDIVAACSSLPSYSVDEGD